MPAKKQSKRKSKTDYKSDLAERLKDSSYAEAYLNAALEDCMNDGYVGGLMLAIRDVIEAQDKISSLWKKVPSIKSRTSLYKTLSEEANPEFKTVIEILKALKVNLHLSCAEGRRAS